jgi:hypothetical protein
MPEKMKALWKGEYIEEEGGAVRPVEFLEGVPARSLTQEEFDQLTGEQQEAMRKSALFEVRTEKEMAPAAEAKKES